ncbi:MAG: DUF2341 domain-containing protein, partial [Firmicutes bacterium]|nr:DUF2341 domain-containing protein [Bacillota bacterium]
MDKRVMFIIVGVVVVVAIIVLYMLSKKLSLTKSTTINNSQSVATTTTTSTSQPVATAITINNSQSIATPSNFQQLLALNLSSIISSPSQLLNLRFCQDMSCTQPLYAWIESYSSDLSTVYVWVKLPNGIPASSSTTIYMQVTSANQYPYTGINAYYNTQYDNGANVFDAYMNFMGTSPIPSNYQYPTNVSGYQYYTNISGVPQFVPKSGTTPGYLYTFNNSTNGYDEVFISAPNSARIPEVFEGMAYYNGTADMQGLMFFSNTSGGWQLAQYTVCGGPLGGVVQFPAYGWAATWDPYDCSPAGIISGSTVEVQTTNSVFTSSGYNFYQVIATNNQIIFNGATPSSPTIPYAQLSIKNVATYKGSITIYGNVVGTIEDSGASTHSGYWYYIRARAYPPNGVMPTVSAITP